jgi:23S rRNA pseudouridine2605 synthase
MATSAWPCFSGKTHVHEDVDMAHSIKWYHYHGPLPLPEPRHFAYHGLIHFTPPRCSQPMTDMSETPDDDVNLSDSTPDESVRIRLQKVLASAGFGSRRHCEELITQGRVEVDRRMVNELGATVDPEAQEIRVDGEKIHIARKAYYLVNKPVGYLSTNYDPAGRPRVVDLLPPTKERLFTVGRLDMSSDGLMLVTNDGEIAQQLTHPRYGVEKTYLVQVAGNPTQEVLDKLVRGVHLAEGVARCVRVTVRSEIKHSTQLEVVLAEGKNREIRRILARVGHKVMTLRRIAIGGLKLKDLKPGEFRRVHPTEIKLLTQHAPPAKLRRRKRRTFQEQDGDKSGPGGKRPRPQGTIIGGSERRVRTGPGGKPGGRPSGRPAGKPPRAEGQSGGRSGGRSEGRPGGKAPGERSMGRALGRSIGKSGGGKPSGKPGRPTGKPAGKPTNRTSLPSKGRRPGRPDGESGGPPRQEFKGSGHPRRTKGRPPQ